MSSQTTTPTPTNVDTGTAFVPNLLLLKLYLSEKQMKRLRDAGVPRIEKSMTRSAELNEEHREAAEAIGRDADRFAIVEKDSDVPIYNSGTPVFTKRGLADVSVMDMINDLAAAGLAVSNVHIEWVHRKDADVLIIGFKPDVAEEVSVPQAVIDFVEGAAFNNVHVWRNPNASVTVNCLAHRQPGAKTTRLRMDPAGRFSARELVRK